MSARVQPAAGAWNAPRWILALALVFALEVSLVFALSWRPGGSIPAPVRPTHLRFVVDTREARRLTDLPWLPDAAQFAQTTPRGFTAGVWSLDAEAALPWPGWREPPVWLEPGKALPTLTRGSFFLRAPLPWVVVADREEPRPAAAAVQAPLVPEGTTLLLEGDIRQRRLLGNPELPPVEADDILPPTVVQVLVGELGTVLSATLQPPGSGLPQADARALEAATKLQFEPAAGGNPKLTWGRVVVRWATRAPAVAPSASEASP